MKKRWMGILLALSMVLTLTATVAACAFTDVNEDLWCRQEILDLTEAGVIGGYEDGTYRPYNTLSCGAALKLVLLAAGYPEQEPTGTHTLSGYYDYALKKGFIDEGEIKDLKADASRLLVARLTARALKLPELDIESPYADTNDGYAKALYTTGIMQGKEVFGVRKLCAADSIKRGEMAAVVWRIMNTEWKAISREATGLIAFQGKWFDILEELPKNPYNEESFFHDEYGYRRSVDGNSRVGIDVSTYQQDIDWEQVAASGVEFAIIRAAYRGYTAGTLNEDTYFHQNMKGAIEAGLDVGVYVFAQAITEAEAIEEAEMLIEMVEPYEITMPLVFDWEQVDSSKARTNNISAEMLTACANAFCDRVEEAGYESSVYFYQKIGYDLYDLMGIKDRNWWLADYNEVPAFYYGGYELWQYSSSGTVPGIKGSVDMNVQFLSEVK